MAKKTESKKKLGFEPYGAQFLVEWNSPAAKTSELILSDELTRAQEASINGINKVAAVGHQCTLLKVGDWVMLPPVPSPILEFYGKEYAVYREHQIMGRFTDGKPSEDMIAPPDMKMDIPIFSEIKLDKTTESLKKFQEKNR
jgi:hypothetical protein